MHIDEKREDRYLDFLARFGGNIWDFCVNASESRDDAADLMQEVFAAVWIGLPKVAPNPRRENRWLYRVMLSVLVRHLKHRLHHVVMNISHTVDSDTELLDTELLDALAEHLDDHERTLMQRLREGYKVHEIAGMLGISASATHMRVSRLKQKLKTIYEKYYGE